MFDIETFKNYKCYVRLPTQDIYDRVMEFLEANGIDWHEGAKATTKNYWPIHEEETVIHFKGPKWDGLRYTTSDRLYMKDFGYKELEIKRGERMTRNELEKKVNELGFVLADIYADGEVSLTDVQKEIDGTSYSVATISEVKEFTINTGWHLPYGSGFELIELFEVLFEYTLTPIKERGVKQKYYLQLPGYMYKHKSYLNYDIENKTYSFSDKYEIDTLQTQFTQEEINDLPNQFFIKTLLKEEVKE